MTPTVVLRSAEERVAALQGLGVVSRNQTMEVDGAVITVSQVHGGAPAIWDIPEAAQFERLISRNETFPGMTDQHPAVNPSWMGVLWNAAMS